MVAYIVTTEFEGSPESVRALADEYRAWLVDGHLRDVVQAGALGASMLEVDGPAPRFEVHYRFADAAAFARYEQGPAIALRAEGAAKFPPTRGVRFGRRTAKVVAEVNA